jgi:hypothetical protein
MFHLNESLMDDEPKEYDVIYNVIKVIFLIFIYHVFIYYLYLLFIFNIYIYYLLRLVEFLLLKSSSK